MSDTTTTDNFGLDQGARNAAERRLREQENREEVTTLDPGFPYETESIDPLLFDS